MTNFLFVFSYQNGSDMELCYRLEVEAGEEKNECIEKTENFLKLFKNNRDNDISVTFAPHLLNHKCIIGPNGNFDTSESEILGEILSKSGISFIKKITILKCYQDISEFDPLLESIYDTLDEVKRIELNPEHTIQKIDNLREYIRQNNIQLSEELIEYYTNNFESLNTLEFFDLLQGNSEHARHHFFNGTFVINGIRDERSLLKKIKATNSYTLNNDSVVAFRDNASVIRGFRSINLESILCSFKKDENEIFYNVNMKTNWTHLTSNAETHNFPTSICPFPGAATGTGGRIRDTISVGKGGLMLSGFCGYYVGDCSSTNADDYPYNLPITTLIEASNGCSDYGNKIGEPVLGGFTRDFKYTYKNDENSNIDRYEYVKPVLYSAGNGLIIEKNVEKLIPQKPEYEGDRIWVVRLGGKAYNIGLGGGNCSSRNQSERQSRQDFVAVQRGNPEMENRVVRLVEKCSNLGLFLSIHDQGSGGMANVTKEIISPCGAKIYLEKVTLGDKSMNDFQIWNSEYQEQCSVLVLEKNLEFLDTLAELENVPKDVIGYLNDSGIVKVYSKDVLNENPVLEFKLSEIEELPEKIINVPLIDICDNILPINKTVFNFINFEPVEKVIETIFENVSVSSKRYLVHKVDRSVGGLVCKQQCVGPWNMPLADYSISHINFFGFNGVATSFGERPFLGLLDISAMISMTIGEMLTNLIFSGASYDSIKCQGNWMWSVNHKNYNYLLFRAVDKLTKMLSILEIGIDGGKDSLSMNIEYRDEKIISPNSFVLKSYSKVPDTRIAIEPYFQKENSDLIYINLGKQTRRRMGGSIYLYTGNYIENDEPPKFDNRIIEVFKNFWDTIQSEMRNGNILSGHDISDGGFLANLIEMSIASNYGMTLYIDSRIRREDYLFNEELGLLLEFNRYHSDNFIKYINSVFPMINAKLIGYTTSEQNIKVFYNNQMAMSSKNSILRNNFEKASFKFEKLQMDNELALEEYKSHSKRMYYNHFIPFNFHELKRLTPNFNKIVLVLRDIGSNSDKEMKAAFFHAGFNVFDLTTDEFIQGIKEGNSLVANANVLAFCGGFSRSDVLGAATGWYNILNSSKRVRKYLEWFYNNDSKFSIGICNGCQLMSQLNWIPKCKIVKNNSKKFESRYPHIKVVPSICKLTHEMDSTFFGMNSAHGEGKIVLDTNCPTEIIKILRYNAPFRYADDRGEPTEKYPFNPNGSKYGLAGLCSDNGNHLAVMPHPERTFLLSQCQYTSKPFKDPEFYYSPWFKIFINIYNRVNE